MRFTTFLATLSLAGLCGSSAFAQTSTMGGGTMMHGSSMSSMSGMSHGMPKGKAGADGDPYLGAPDLQTASSFVAAGGPPGNFSIARAMVALAGPQIAATETAKLKAQYGAAKFGSFVTVVDFAVNDSGKIAMAQGIKFPAPTLSGKALAAKLVNYGLEDGTYYEGPHLDHLVSNKIHEQVMDDIDQKYGAAADANYHRVADQAHYDLAHALGVKTVKLAAYH